MTDHTPIKSEEVREEVQNTPDSPQIDSENLKLMTSRLLDTSGILHSFIHSLQKSGFQEYVDYMGRPWYAFWFNLLVGAARGFGFVLGATVVVAIFAYILTQFLVELPLVGEFFQFIERVITDPDLQKGVESGALDRNLSDLFEAFKTDVLR